MLLEDVELAFDTVEVVVEVNVAVVDGGVELICIMFETGTSVSIKRYYETTIAFIPKLVHFYFGGHLFSMNAKLSEKLIFLTPVTPTYLVGIRG